MTTAREITRDIKNRFIRAGLDSSGFRQGLHGGRIRVHTRRQGDTFVTYIHGADVDAMFRELRSYPGIVQKKNVVGPDGELREQQVIQVSTRPYA